MKKNSLMLLVLLFIGLSYNANAQVNERMYRFYKKEAADSLMKANAHKRDSIINNAEFIFEGKVIQTSNFLTDSGFVSCKIVRIEKIYRGHEKLKFGIIEVFTNPHSNAHINTENNILFCNSSNIKTCFENQKFDNEIKVALSNNLITMSPESEEITGLFDLYFSNYSKARNFLSKYPNIDIKDESSQKKSTLKSGIIKEGINFEQNEINKQKYFQMQKRYEKLRNQQKGSKSLKSATTNTTDLYYTITNVKNVAGATPSERWLQFDIMAKSNVSGTYLDNAVVHLEYSTGTLDIGGDFFRNSYTNDCIKVFRGANFNTSNYDDVNVMDINGSKLSFQLGTNGDPNITITRSVITTTYQQLMRVQLKIKNANESTTLKLSFDEPTMMFVSFYTFNPTSNDGAFYDNPVFENLTSVPLSPSPVISSFTAMATAGTGTRVVITGQNFGEPNFPTLTALHANHNVRFKSADYQGPDAPELTKRQLYCDFLDNNDYVANGWTSTRIEFIVPSFIWIEGAQVLTPGSGNFYVKNDWGKETLSSQPISIQYGLSAKKETNLLKQKILIPRRNCIDGLKFRIDPALKTNTSAMNAITKAFKTWSDVLGIVVDFDKDVSGEILTATGSAIDGYNVIYYSNVTSFMGTNTHNSFNETTGLSTCGNNSGTVAGIKDVDITINNTVAWNWDLTSSYSSGNAYFYDCILHELGHALGLAHTLEPNDLMNADISSARRTLNTGSGYSLFGANQIVTQSKSTTWSCENLITLLAKPSATCPFGRVGATLNNPIQVGSLSIGATYTDTKDNSPDNNYSNEYTGPNNQLSDDIFYKFTLTANSDVTISLCNSTSYDTYLHLLNSDGTWNFSNDDYCESKSRISKTLNAGTYYFVVEGAYTNFGSITTNMTVSAVIPKPIGALLSNPIQIGSLSIGAVYNNTIDNSPINNYGDDYTGPNNQSSDDVFYKFTLSTNSDVFISLCNSTLYLTYLHLLNSDGSWICSKYKCDDCEEISQIVKTLNAGTYYLVVEGVYNDCGSITTDITVSATVPIPVGALLSNPIQLGTLSNGTTYTDTKDNSILNKFGNDFNPHCSDSSSKC
jgi:hypothetical protein